MGKRKWTEEENKYIKDNYNNMLSREIAEHLNRSLNSVRKHAEWLGITHPAKIYSCDERFFQNIDTPEKAYWLGFIAADGCVVDNDYHYRVKIALQRGDKDHLEKFRKAIHGNMPIRDAVSKYKVNGEYRETPECTIIIHSKSMVKDLERLNIIPNKTYSLQFARLPEKLMSHYLRGFVDGDGNFYYRYRELRTSSSVEISIVGASKGFIDDYAKYLELHDISVGVYKKPHYENWRAKCCNRFEAYKLIKLLYKDVNDNICLTRKHIKAKEMGKVIAVELGDKLNY